MLVSLLCLDAGKETTGVHSSCRCQTLSIPFDFSNSACSV